MLEPLFNKAAGVPHVVVTWINIIFSKLDDLSTTIWSMCLINDSSHEGAPFFR